MVHSENGIFNSKMKWYMKPWKDMSDSFICAYYKVKEASLKRLYNVWFQLYDIVEKRILWRMWKDQWFSEVGVGWNEHVQHKRFLGQWKYSVWYVNDGYMSLYILCTHRIYNTESEP